MSSKNHYILYFTPFQEYLLGKWPDSAVENFLSRAATCPGARLPLSANFDSVQRFATETTVHRGTPQGAEVVQVLCAGVQKQENASAAGTAISRATKQCDENKGAATASPERYLGWEVRPVTRNTGFSFSAGSIWKVSEVRLGS